MKWLKAAFASVAALLLMSAPIHAAEQTGEINVYFPEEVQKGNKMDGSVFGLYTIALTKDNEYVLTEDFKDLTANWEDFNDKSKTEALSRRIVDMINEDEIDPFPALPVTDAGSVTFTNLQPGVYFCAQLRMGTDRMRVTPFLATIPYNGSYVVEAYTKTTGVTPTTPTGSDIPQGGIYGDTPTTTTTLRTPSRDISIPLSGMDAWMIPFFAVGGLFCLALGSLLVKGSKSRSAA